MRELGSKLMLPFSEFFQTNYGYIQDQEILLPTASISTFGLTLVDKVIGPFELEMQHITAVRRATTRTEKT